MTAFDDFPGSALRREPCLLHFITSQNHKLTYIYFYLFCRERVSFSPFSRIVAYFYSHPLFPVSSFVMPFSASHFYLSRCWFSRANSKILISQNQADLNPQSKGDHSLVGLVCGSNESSMSPSSEANPVSGAAYDYQHAIFILNSHSDQVHFLYFMAWQCYSYFCLQLFSNHYFIHGKT